MLKYIHGMLGMMIVSNLDFDVSQLSISFLIEGRANILHICTDQILVNTNKYN